MYFFPRTFGFSFRREIGTLVVYASLILYNGHFKPNIVVLKKSFTRPLEIKCCRPTERMTLPVLQVDPDSAQDFDSTYLPLSSPFLGESGSYQVYGIGDDTGNYTVSYVPLVRGNYSVTVKTPAIWEVQVVQTVVEATGEDLSGEICCSLGVDCKPPGDSSGLFLPIPGTEWVGTFILLTLDFSRMECKNFMALHLVVVPGSQ